MLGLLFLAGRANGVGQNLPTTNPALERIKLTLVDNKSTFLINDNQNDYINTLRINQPDGDYKLTAGMLNLGDNQIVIHRTDDSDNTTDVARINLKAEKTMPASSSIGNILDFYSDDNPPASATNVTQRMLPANWGTNGTGLQWQTNGCLTITAQGGLTYTVPDGYSDAIVYMVILLGENARGGYFGTNQNSEGWYVTDHVSAGDVLVSLFVVNSGDVISIYGGEQEGTSYYLAQSPDIKAIGIYPKTASTITELKVTPTISTRNGENWGAAESFGNVLNASVNESLDYSDFGIVTDHFTQSTESVDYPDYYRYTADLDAQILTVSDDATALDFYASIDFSTATTTAPTSGTMVGPNRWSYYGATVYAPAAGTCCYIYGALLYTLPNTFLGNSVRVTVTTSTGDGGGDLYVNGVAHTFTAGQTYTWTIPVSANGMIEFKPSANDNFTPDITSIIISSGNGHAMSAPAPTYDNEHSTLNGMPMPQATRKIERSSMKTIND